METKTSIIQGLFTGEEYTPREKIDLTNALVTQSITLGCDFSKLSQQERDELFFTIQGELMKRNPRPRSPWEEPQSEDYQSQYSDSDFHLLLYLGSLYREAVFSDNT